MTITAERTNGRNVHLSVKDVERLDSVAIPQSHLYRDMCHALGEGTLGRSFRAFHASDPKAAQWIVRDAMAHFASIRASWPLTDGTSYTAEIGAFAHNYTESVAETLEPTLPDMVNHFGRNAWMRDAWELWAKTVQLAHAVRNTHNHSIGTPCNTRCRMWGKA